MTKRIKKYCGPSSSALESQIDIDFAVVGTPNWFSSAWEPDALRDVPKIIVFTVRDLEQVFEFLRRKKRHGIDTETTGLSKPGNPGYTMNPVNPDVRMVLFQIGNKDKVYLIQPELIPYFKEFLESDKYLHLLHNGIYDFKWILVKYGVHLNRIYCSMLAEQVLTAGLPAVKVNLAECVRKYDPHYIISKQVRDSFITLDDEGRKMTYQMAYYSARDIVLLFSLFEEQVKELKKWKLEKTAALEFQTIFSAAEMEIEGVHLDLPIMNQIIEYWESELVKKTDRILELFELEKKDHKDDKNNLIPELSEIINLNSNVDKLRALKEIDIDLDNIQRSSLKDLAGDKNFTAQQRELARELAEYTRITKMTSTYGKNMVNKINTTTNRWHPRFHQLGSGEGASRSGSVEDSSTAATGRFSSDAQQLPKIQELFTPVPLTSLESKILYEKFGEKITRSKV